MPYAFKTESNVMARAIQREVLLRCPRHVMREKWPRIRIVQEICVSGNDHKRRAAVSNVGRTPIYSGYPQIATLKLSIPETGDRLALTSPPKNSVPQERR